MLFPSSPAELIPPPGGGEFWNRVVASTPVARLNTTARIMDPTVFAQLDSGGPYAFRAVYFFTAEAGGPSLVWRLNGPALFNPGGTTPATALNAVLGLAAGSQDTTSANIADTTRLTYHAADVSTVWNTGGPARAMGRIEVRGVIQVTAPGAFGIEWTSNSGLWALTRLAGSYIEYAALF
jgi:hypothetical protein